MFWATWCPICMNELPAYQTLSDRYRDDGFEVVALSVDEDRADVRECLRRSGLSFPVAMRTAALEEA
ncbi:MAG TPA: TlpA disulfide reductase family protein [Rhodocyclaceae bacterium]|nr:TlpA disulfide reductase family protein [Rhodocyclaceae bacterium]